jgi:hypothetical protein
MNVARRAGTSDSETRFSEVQAAIVTANEARSRRAARVVASLSTDAQDCIELLAMLGLSEAAGRPIEPGAGSRID